MGATTQEEIDLSKLDIDGVTAKGAVSEVTDSILPKRIPQKDGTVKEVFPTVERQREINDNLQSLEGIVKGELDKDIKANPLEARKILNKLSYELAKAEGYQGKPEELTAEQKVGYITRAGQALGNSTIQNFTQLVESIVNMAAARPGDPLYNRESDLAQLIGYVATQKNTAARRIQFLQTQLATVYNKPGVGLKIIDEFSKKANRPYANTATLGDIIGDINQIGTLEAQKAAATGAKTYLKTHGHYSSPH